MEYYNIIILVIIFLLLLISFYLIINNLGIKSNDDIIYKNNYDELTNELLEQKLLILKNELSLLKNKIYSNNNDIQKNIITEQNNLSEKNNLLETNSISNNKNEDKEIIIEQDNTSNNITKPPPIIYNPIANYDIAKLTDPLVDPRGRTSADQIPTPQVAMQFNFPTQGVLDRYHRIGLLIAIDNNKRKNKNLEIIKQKFNIIKDNTINNINNKNILNSIKLYLNNCLIIKLDKKNPEKTTYLDLESQKIIIKNEFIDILGYDLDSNDLIELDKILEFNKFLCENISYNCYEEIIKILFDCKKLSIYYKIYNVLNK